MQTTRNLPSYHGIHVFFVGIGVISWKFKKQPTNALSTTEAEYIATSYYTKEAVWLRQLLIDVAYVPEGPTSIMCDNQGTLHIILTSEISMYNITSLEIN